MTMPMPMPMPPPAAAAAAANVVANVITNVNANVNLNAAACCCCCQWLDAEKVTLGGGSAGQQSTGPRQPREGAAPSRQSTAGIKHGTNIPSPLTQSGRTTGILPLPSLDLVVQREYSLSPHSIGSYNGNIPSPLTRSGRTTGIFPLPSLDWVRHAGMRCGRTWATSSSRRVWCVSTHPAPT
eukprot:1183071-Prorocentrum_minimum.AAC.2